MFVDVDPCDGAQNLCIDVELGIYAAHRLCMRVDSGKEVGVVIVVDISAGKERHMPGNEPGLLPEFATRSLGRILAPLNAAAGQSVVAVTWT